MGLPVKILTDSHKEDYINDLVDEWHTSDSELPLHEYLGLTWEDYKEIVSPDVATGDYLDILAEIPVKENIHYCQYNDCGWCYYRGDGNSNDKNSQCNKPQQCEVNINEE